MRVISIVVEWLPVYFQCSVSRLWYYYMHSCHMFAICMNGNECVWWWCCIVKALNDGVLDTVLSVCHANSPAEVWLAALQYIAAVSSRSIHVCDALTDHTHNSTLVKLLALTSSSDTSVCTLLNVVSVAFLYCWRHSSELCNRLFTKCLQMLKVKRLKVDIYIPPLTEKPWPAAVYNSKWRTDRQWH